MNTVSSRTPDRSAVVTQIRPVEWLRRWSAFLLLAGAFGALVGVGAVDRLDPSYEVTFGVLVGPLEADADLLEGSADLARTYGEVLESRETIRAVAAELGVPAATIEVAATSAAGSSLLDVRVRSQQPEVSRQLPAALFEELQATIEAGRSSDDPAVTQPGSGPISGTTIVAVGADQPSVTDRSVPRWHGTIGGAASAMMLAATFALAVDRRRRALSTTMDGFVDLGDLAIVPIRAPRGVNNCAPQRDEPTRPAQSRRRGSPPWQRGRALWRRRGNDRDTTGPGRRRTRPTSGATYRT